ncbi:MAG: recombination protein RecR [Candidatus Ryanbacteria bacterium CG10_big_fil_rev_8_21_14_0_10_43_42]|uniref:Recombination protein RecR n=1 Tax=Candidatus Ryanbacteria bacterium CG10_big_fil_rev_8_21_14_0_10_43_42 TaxID=1974864 RepID=A0A2M8KW15_9BACT|nr:MAG: recombination protein RecR [Candidatus Ryanbacteria bacterium CG10_big_fil_rev_8_21_14_0_10_43_42]
MAYPKRLKYLIDHLRELPGIGPRQAVRLSYALAKKDASYLKRFAEDIRALSDDIIQCSLCFRMTERHTNTTRCDICLSESRNKNIILVVEKESDVEVFESSGTYTGLYHVTGGSISPLEKSPGEKLHLRELFERIKAFKDPSSVEVIVATSNTLPGNQTANYIERILDPLPAKLTRLGRGLSTGAEIEYADILTLDAALKNRT